MTTKREAIPARTEHKHPEGGTCMFCTEPPGADRCPWCRRVIAVEGTRPPEGEAFCLPTNCEAWLMERHLRTGLPR